MAKPRQPTLETVQSLSQIRRDLYGLLSTVYIHLPEKKTLKLKWEPAVELLRYPQKGSEEALKQIDKGLKLVHSYGSKKDRPDEDILTNLSRDWTRLFRGVVRDGILPPYESLYRKERLQRKPAQDINRLFSKMGIQVPDEWHQPSDYIGVELDFMRFLCEKESRLREQEDRHGLREAVEAEKSFLEDHLALWVPVYCKGMMKEAREDYYLGIAHLTLGFIEFDRPWVPKLLA